MKIRIEASPALLRALPGVTDLIGHWGVDENGKCVVFLDLLNRPIKDAEVCVLEFEAPTKEGACSDGERCTMRCPFRAVEA